MPADNSRISTKLRRAPTRYVPTQRIAAGGMAEVWKGLAHFEGGDSYPVALKRVLPELASQELYHSMFMDEARLGMQLRHRNIVRVYDAREVQGSLIMVMELVEGTTLKAVLDRAHARGACMPVATALWITRELAHGLAYAHEAQDATGRPLQIVHRDVSPHNLLLGKDGAVKLADFGLADANVHETQLGGGMMGGKLGYLAPEIIQQQPTTPQIDVFAAGIVLWEMLCGRRLFQRDDDGATVRAVAACEVPRPSSINPRIPREVDRLVIEVLARDPAKRTPGAEALASATDELIRWLDPKVSTKDVALVVGLQLATEPPKPTKTVLPPAPNFLAELDTLAETANESDFGAAPLDPSLFDGGRRRR
ncbi:serine/threonine-protein kinase [Sandaracinus amylolyticus]|uniref:serine/threonine-protein kinase n=1 Tax=Sandaracinus amylolyticus TaxID=927083 RepID=UPI001F42B4D7|nr:serine/threonine-protein kinase [Sandaracinus amylolyticus]UJR80087.1 Serine/threonine protein kinase [Sandaracinus amylolyticus]